MKQADGEEVCVRWAPDPCASSDGGVSGLGLWVFLVVQLPGISQVLLAPLLV